MTEKLIIGTRGSQMAVIQTEQVATALRHNQPGLTTELKIITTKGDRNMAPIPAGAIGKAWFTAEIEQALTGGQIHLAVHSLKDLAPETPAGLRIGAVLPRQDPRDALVSKHGETLARLRPGAIVGTDSVRRKVNLLALRPDLVVTSIRGNVITRLAKLKEADYDALVLAAAGLERLGMADTISEYFDPRSFVPSVGQGALAIEAVATDPALWRLVESIQDPATVRAVAAEQAFATTIGGGCKLPVGCYVEFEGDTATVHGMVGSAKTFTSVVESANGPAEAATRLATELATRLRHHLVQS